MVKFISSSASETENIGKKLAKKLKGTEVIALFGGLGAGKTAFTRGLSEGLGFEDGVSSPTFALVHEYEGKFPIFHFDMYRVTTYDDLYSTGFFVILATVFWLLNGAKISMGVLPNDAIRITIKPLSENEREITISGVDIE